MIHHPRKIEHLARALCLAKQFDCVHRDETEPFEMQAGDCASCHELAKAALDAGALWRDDG